MQVQSLYQEDHLEKEMAAHSSILAWKIPWTEDSGKLQSMGSQRVGHDLETEHQARPGLTATQGLLVLSSPWAQGSSGDAGNPLGFRVAASPASSGSCSSH